MSDHKLRRNDVVIEKQSGGMWSPYGRVVRRIDNNHVQVIFCTKDIKVFKDEELELSDYDGRWDTHGGLRERFPVWMPFPTLRKLKQMASYYQEDVWKKPKPPRGPTQRAKWIAEECIHAPWTDRQVYLINQFQQFGQYGAETCGNHYPKRDHRKATRMSKRHEAYQEKHGLRLRGQMTATPQGFVCPVCKDTKTYADRYMLLGDYNPID